MLLFEALLISSLAVTQGQTPSPGLQQRPSGETADQPVSVVKEGGKPILPEDGYGLYRFPDNGGRSGNFGEGLQIDNQFDEVSGYFSISSDNGHGKLATYFLSKVSGGDGHFAFTTRQVHGLWYSFDGRATRGPGLTRAQDAFYVLDGTLTLHDEAGKTTQPRTVTLRLTGLRLNGVH